jgi:hypothetical protein
VSPWSHFVSIDWHWAKDPTIRYREKQIRMLTQEQ